VNVSPLANPLDGEQIVAVDPPLAPRVDAGWRRRLNLFTGRSLDASALAAEQRARATKSALLARALTPGIVNGLEVSLAGSGFGNAELDLAPGLGITAWGEDVRLARGLRVRLDLLQVVDLMAGDHGGGAGLTLRELLDQNASVPPALILALQPVLVEEIGVGDPFDACERDPQTEAFEDQRTADACRPLLVPWPAAWPLPDPGPHWRNQLAWIIFEKARTNPGELLPWEEAGVPLGLVGNDTFGERPANRLFLDRSSVARIGGRPRSRTALLPAAGDPGLWQARIQQAAEHLVDLLAVPGATATEAARSFERLPPAGLLPREAALTISDGSNGPAGTIAARQSIFPGNFAVTAVPIPSDELEPVFEASAPLAPLDLVKDEVVQILVPVPGSLYEPDLLVQEKVDPAFATTLADFRLTRNRWLGRRQDLRDKAGALTRALGGTVARLPFSETDADAQAGEAPVLPPAPPEEAFGTTGAFGARKSEALQDLESQFRQGRFLKIQREWDATLLGREGLGGLIRELTRKVSQANDKIDLGFLHLQTEIYRVRQIVLGNVAGTRLATSPVLAEIAQGDSARATRESLERVFTAARDQESFAEATLALELAPLPFVSRPPALATVAVTGPTPVLTANLRAEIAVPVSDDVRGQQPLPGANIDFRNLSIAERLQVPPAAQALNFALANQLQILSGLSSIGLVLDDLAIPLMVPKGTGRDREDRPFSSVLSGGLESTILSQPAGAGADEATFLGDAAAFQENASLILRRLEDLVHLYAAALESCRATAAKIDGNLAAARQRLGEIDRVLLEARHDVAVGLSLQAEELARVDKINARRREILTHHVHFLAWHRPRVVDTLAGGPVRPLDPPLAEDPVPAALARPVHPPIELRKMVDLLRRAPLRWFRFLPVLLDRFNRLDVLQETLRFAKGRAEMDLAQPVLAAPLVSANPAAAGTGKTLAAQSQMMAQLRTETARVDLAAVERQSWQGAAALARDVLSVGDLLDIPHGFTEVTRLGAQELDRILRVATALWAGFGEVLPALRLDWVDRLSEFDAPYDLRRLASLPRWDEIEVEDRRSLQALVDWLFQRVDPAVPQAVALMNDLVRVCVLLASHAPVDRLVSGKVAEDTPIRTGGIVPLEVEITRVRIGMPVLLYAQETVAARAVVEDLGGGRAYARVLETTTDQPALAKNARAEFTEAPELA
jgi:hypothetical protein